MALKYYRKHIMLSDKQVHCICKRYHISLFFVCLSFFKRNLGF